MAQLTDTQLNVITRVRKLFALAGNNPNEAEAASALAKAQELLDAYQIASSQVGTDSTGPVSAKRNDEKLSGGLYTWQRTLWAAIAESNYCVYWSIKGLKSGQTYQHRLLGSEVNVLSAKLLADYLQGAIERIGREWAKERGKNVFCRDALAYKEGMADRIVQRLRSRRWEQERQAEQDRKAKSTGTNALVLASVAQSEKDANDDYLYGEGYSARRRTRQAEYEAKQAKAQADLKAWEEAHPEEAKAKKEQEAKEYAELLKKWARSSARREKAEKGPRSHTYYAGYDKGADVSLDQQVSAKAKAKQIA